MNKNLITLMRDYCNSFKDCDGCVFNDENGDCQQDDINFFTDEEITKYTSVLEKWEMDERFKKMCNLAKTAKFAIPNAGFNTGGTISGESPKKKADCLSSEINEYYSKEYPSHQNESARIEIPLNNGVITLNIAQTKPKADERDERIKNFQEEKKEDNRKIAELKRNDATKLRRISHLQEITREMQGKITYRDSKIDRLERNSIIDAENLKAIKKDRLGNGQWHTVRYVHKGSDLANDEIMSLKTKVKRQKDNLKGLNKKLIEVSGKLSAKETYISFVGEGRQEASVLDMAKSIRFYCDNQECSSCEYMTNNDYCTIRKTIRWGL